MFDQLRQWDQFAVGMQKAEVAGAAVTFGQDMFQDQAQECHAAEHAGFAVLVAERDAAIAVCNDILLGQYESPRVYRRLYFLRG